MPEKGFKTVAGTSGWGSFSKHAYKHIHVGSFGPSLALNGFEKLPHPNAPLHWSWIHDFFRQQAQSIAELIH